MRLLLAAVVLAGLLPTASGQLPGQVLTIDQVLVEASPLEPGNATAMRVTFTRTCPNAAGIYHETPAEVAVLAQDANWTVEGPRQVVFPQHVCAQGLTKSLEVAYKVTAPRDAARGETHLFLAKGRLAAASQVTPPSNEATFPFTIGTTPAPPVAPLAESIERESPSAGAAALLLGLGLAALAARRR